jgi:ribonuclease BN (tRNA processing enzyme)
MHDLELTFIGTGNAFSPDGMCCNGFLVNRRVLFEAPPQALSSLNRIGYDPNELDAVAISHHHGDHFLGLPFLLLHWRWKGRTKPVHIVGPAGTEALTKDIARKVFPGVLKNLDFEIRWSDLQPGEWVTAGGMDLTAHEMVHDDGLEMCLGYECSAAGRRFAYTGDSTLCEAVYGLARNAEVLVSECASRDEHIPVHMNLVDDMPKVRAEMPASSRLILTHLGPGIDAAGLANTVVAEDFATYRF